MAATLLSLEFEQDRCYACGELRFLHQLTTCPKCGVSYCEVERCSSKCKCDSLPNADFILSSPEFRRLYCFCSNPEKCEGCFFETTSDELKATIINFTKDRNSRYVYVSNTYCTLLGHRASEMLGRTSFEVFEDHELANVLVDGDHAAMAGQVDTRICRKLNRCGDEYIYLVRKFLLPNGLIRGMAIDLTQFVHDHPYDGSNYAGLHRVIKKIKPNGFAIYSQEPL